jgi:peptide/nickel transport system substrate-binding protein
MKKIYVFMITITLIVSTTFIITISTTFLRAEKSSTENTTNENLSQKKLNYSTISEQNAIKLGLFGRPKTLNESIATDDASSVLINHLFIPLFVYGQNTPEWTLLPADRERSSSGKGYDITHTKENDPHTELTVYLRDDVLWSDGMEMTADDWVWYFNKVVCNKKLSHPAYQNTLINMNEWEKRQTYYEKIDDYSFKIIFPRIVAEPELLGNSQPMPKHVIEPLLKEKGIDGVRLLWSFDNELHSESIVSNGCFEFRYYNSDGIVLEKNKDFFLHKDLSDEVPLEYIIYKVIYDIRNIFDGKIYPAKFSEYTYFKEGLIDGIVLDKTSLDKLSMIKGNAIALNEIRENDQIEVLKRVNQGQNDYLSFNQNTGSKHFKSNPEKVKWFREKQFRQAISLLINRENIISDIYNQIAQINGSLLPKNSPYFDENIRFNVEYNPDKALRLLKGIGIKDRDGDSTLEGKDGKAISFEILTNDSPDRVSIANFISDELNRHGIASTVNITSFTLLTTRLIEGDWDSVIVGFVVNPFPLTYENLLHSRGNMHIWYPEQWKPSTDWEKDIDKLFDEYTKESVFSSRRRIVNEILTTFYEQMPIIPLGEKHSYLLLSKDWIHIDWKKHYSFGYSGFVRTAED